MEFKLSRIKFNPFAKFFSNAKPKIEVEKEAQIEKNSQGKTQEEINKSEYQNNLGVMNPGVIFSDVEFTEYFKSKLLRIAKYREMSIYPEVSDGIDNVCDDAIVFDENGDILSLDIDDSIKMPKVIESKIRNAWDYIVDEVFKFDENGWRLFKDWLIEAELYIEIILDKTKKNVIGLKKLPAFTMYPMYEGTKIVGYKQCVNKGKEDEQDVFFSAEQIIYVNYGLFGKDLTDVRGYLEAAIRPYNQLVSLEDSTVVYKLVRAPQRKVWNVDVGKMPTGKAREFINKMIQQYKKKSIYDSTTGKVDITQNIQSMSEDYWFAKNSEGKGTSVDTIGGDMDLGPLNELDYFLKKLYKVLKLPKSRWDTERDNVYTGGRIGEISREEVKFANFISRLQGRFKYVLLQPFLLLLKLRGIDERYINDRIYNVLFNKSNMFAEYRHLELLQSKFDILGNAVEYIVTDENEFGPDGIYAKEYVLRNMLNMSDQEMEANEKFIKKEKAERKLKADQEEKEAEKNDTEEPEEKEEPEDNVENDEKDNDEKEPEEKEVKDKDDNVDKDEED